MKINDRIVVVTGGGSGIGAALCRRFHEEGARLVVVADRDGERAEKVAGEIGGLAVTADSGNEREVTALCERAEKVHGRIDLFCSNAGIGVGGGVEAPDGEWQRIWEVNVMAHVWAARAVVPGMIARGHGYLLNTSSAAGLITSIGSAPYAVTKHAAVALAEWLAITYGDRGVRVSCLCPLGVDTELLAAAAGTLTGASITGSGRVISVEDVADSVVRGIEEERFLILPHAEVRDLMSKKTGDVDRWLAGMRRFQRECQARLAGQGDEGPLS